MSNSIYLISILNKYKPRDLASHIIDTIKLKNQLKDWAGDCFIEIIKSGSREKGTAISIASDVDYLVSLKSDCNENDGGLEGIYESLYKRLRHLYSQTRKQNVSIRVILGTLEVDITPARKQRGNTNDHWVYVSKYDTRKQTNIQKHITDVSQSGRTNEIKLLKIWRELNKLDFPSIYLEYLIINVILLNKSKDVFKISENFWYVLNELTKSIGNPLNTRIVDPANSSNILSDLLNSTEKNLIITAAKKSVGTNDWKKIVW